MRRLRKLSSPTGGTAFVVSPPKSAKSKKKIASSKTPITPHKFFGWPPKRSISHDISGSPSARSAVPSVALRGIPAGSVPRSLPQMSPVSSDAPYGADSALSGLGPSKSLYEKSVEKYEAKMTRSHPKLAVSYQPSRTYSHRQESCQSFSPSGSGSQLHSILIFERRSRRSEGVPPLDQFITFRKAAPPADFP